MTQTLEHYSVADRSVGLLPLTATLVMTEFNTATLIAFSSLGYLAGLKALCLPFVFLIGLLFYAIIVAKKWKAYNGFSVVDFFIDRFGRRIGGLTGLFLLIAMFGFSATYLKSLLFLFQPLFPGLNDWALSALLAILTLSLVIRRGLKSIIRLDMLAFSLLLVLLPWMLWDHLDSLVLLDKQAISLSFDNAILSNSFVASLIPLTMFSYILAPWYGQRMFAAKNTTVAFQAVVLSAIFVFLFYSIGVLVCFALAQKGVVLSDPQAAFPVALHTILKRGFYPWGYFILFLIAATSLTGLWNAMANIILEVTPKAVNCRRWIIAITVCCALMTYLLTNLLVDNILNKMILANIPVVALSFALLAGFYQVSVSRQAVYASMLVGIIAGLGSYCYFGETGHYTFYWAFYGIPAIFITGFCVHNIVFRVKLSQHRWPNKIFKHELFNFFR